MCKEIPLRGGKVAVVSDEDYEYLSAFRWFASKSINTIYARRKIRIDGKYTSVGMHRVVAARMGLDPSLQVDHMDRDGLNNRRANLREATNKQNGENRSIQRNNTSGISGVGLHKATGKWLAMIKHHGKHIHLGLFADIEDAKTARLEAEKIYWTHAH